MTSTQQTSILILILIFPLIGFSAKPTNDLTRSPLGCRDVGYKFEMNTLRILTSTPGEHQSLYFVMNHANQPVHLYQMLPNSNASSTYLNHKIHAQEWAVIATGDPELTYICTMDQPGNIYGKIVPCADHLKVCEYTRVRFGLNNRGNFWVVNSNSRGGAVGDVVRYGIIPQ